MQTRTSQESPELEPCVPLCDVDAARRALALMSALLTAACTDPELGDSGTLHIVIMNPLRTPRDCSFDDAVLLEAAFGDARGSAALYAGFARAKALLSWQHNRDSLELQQAQPQRLSAGDTTLGGSVALDGIVVAASGCHAVYDEALSGALAMCLRGVVKARAEAQRHAGNLYFRHSSERLASCDPVRQKGTSSCNG